MKKRTCITGLLLFALFWKPMQAQITGLSYTFSPAGEYHVWDDQAGLEDGLVYGGKVGFGFGEFIELQGIYLFSNDLKTDFSEYGFANFDEDLFTQRNVNYQRYGADLKVNFGRTGLRPYVLVGSGVQTFELENAEKNEQLFLSLGGGLTFRLDDRINFLLEVRNHSYNFNSGRNLLTAEDRTAQGIADTDLESLSLNHWSYGASLNIYLGGRRRGTLSDLDRAYLNTFKGGLSIPFEPTLARINWADELPYRDTWLGGGYAGIDFNEYVGIRGFYLQAMENDEVSTDFDELAMYGGELNLKLNTGIGLVPTLMLGGGYIDVDNDYVGRDSVSNVSSQGFASGGIGIDVPVSTNFKLFGAAKALLTTSSDVENLESTEGINTSVMYTMGVKLILGKKNNPDAVIDQRVQQAVSQAVEEQKAQNLQETKALRTKYEAEIVALEKQLNQAYGNQDLDQAVELLEQKQSAELVLKELDLRLEEIEQRQRELDRRALAPAPAPAPSRVDESRIQMSPAEFENLLEEIIENMDERRAAPLQQTNTIQNQELELKMQKLELMMEQMEAQKYENELLRRQSMDADQGAVNDNFTKMSAQLLVEMRKLNDEIAKNREEIQNIKSGQTTEKKIIIRTEEGQTIEKKPLSQDTTSFFSRVYSKDMSLFTGPSFGEQFSYHVGLRGHYGIKDSNFDLLPEVFYGFGDPNTFGLALHGVIPFKLGNSPLKPYAGAGLGFINAERDNETKLQFGINFIAGTYLNLADGQVYVDYTARNLFRYNQVAIGYRFNFGK